MARQKKTAKPAQTAAEYRHQEKTPARPDVGTQPQLKKRAPPKTWRYDSSLSPSLDWDGQNAAREQGDALIREILEAKSLDKAKAAADKLKAISKPFLNWAGKAERLSFDVPTLPLFIHERLSTRAILETLKGHKQDKQIGLFDLFADPQRPIHDQVLRAYEYQDEWVNRMILGDSMVVMNSMIHYESLGGQVQMIYMDPPYGVKFGSNFQPFVRKRDVTHGDDDDNGQMHDYVPDFILRLNGSSGRHLILEIKGFDEREDIKKSAAERWINAVNADGGFGVWKFAIAKKVSDVPALISSAAH